VQREERRGFGLGQAPASRASPTVLEVEADGSGRVRGRAYFYERGNSGHVEGEQRNPRSRTAVQLKDACSKCIIRRMRGLREAAERLLEWLKAKLAKAWDWITSWR
jgi:hypothetical protein